MDARENSIRAIREKFEITEEAANFAYDKGVADSEADILDCMEDDMQIDRAVMLASLWRAGKLIGGDAHSVSVALLSEIERLQGKS